MDKPLVSVLMPVYNSAQYLEAAITSILEQTYTHLELILINDASTDGSLSIIKAFKELDDRIILVNSVQNLGIGASLNKGIRIARGTFIARMDADDIAFRDRISNQVEFLLANRNTVAVGMNYKYFGTEIGITELEGSNESLQFKKYFECPLPHPTVMMKAATLAEHNLRYTEDKSKIEDWLFWMELSKFGELCIMNMIGLKYRTHPESFTNLNQHKHRCNVIDIYKEYLPAFYIELNDEIIDWHYHLSFSVYKKSSAKDYYLGITGLLQKVKRKTTLKQQKFVNKKIEKLFYVIADHELRTAFLYAMQFKILNLAKFIYLIKKAVYRK